MTDRTLPPSAKCTDPRHTGRLRDHLGCTGPDPAEEHDQATRAAIAIAPLEAAFAKLQAKQHAKIRAEALNAAADELAAEQNFRNPEHALLRYAIAVVRRMANDAHKETLTEPIASPRAATVAAGSVITAELAAAIDAARAPLPYTDARAAFMQIGSTPSLAGLRTELHIEGHPPLVGRYCGAGMHTDQNSGLRLIEPRLAFEYATKEEPAEEDDAPTETCRPVEVDGETIQVHGTRALTKQEQGFAADIVRAAKQKYAAEHPKVDTTEQPETEATHEGPSPFHFGSETHRGTRDQCSGPDCGPDEAETPADELHQAADDLEAHLTDPELTPGPWLSMCRGDRILQDFPGADSLPPVRVIDEPMSNGANADYIALMHPSVGRHLVELLRTEASVSAEIQQQSPYMTPDQLAAMSHGPLAIARVINNRPR